jgi:hypothetical protein
MERCPKLLENSMQDAACNNSTILALHLSQQKKPKKKNIQEVLV